MWNDNKKSSVLDIIEWKMKYTEIIDSVYVLNDMIQIHDGEQRDDFSMSEVEDIIESLCLN